MYNMLQYFIHVIIYMALLHIHHLQLRSVVFQMAVNTFTQYRYRHFTRRLTRIQAEINGGQLRYISAKGRT